MATTPRQAMDALLAGIVVPAGVQMRVSVVDASRAYLIIARPVLAMPDRILPHVRVGLGDGLWRIEHYAQGQDYPEVDRNVPGGDVQRRAQELVNRVFGGEP